MNLHALLFLNRTLGRQGVPYDFVQQQSKIETHNNNEYRPQSNTEL